jgi:hypothetical protein
MEEMKMDKTLKEFVKFIIDNGWEFHTKDEYDPAHIFIDFTDIKYFADRIKELFGNVFEEQCLMCFMKGEYIAINLDDILELIDRQEFEDEKEFIDELKKEKKILIEQN